MELELLISPSGLGKTSKILNEIEKEKDESKIIVITPEQNGYNFEKMLCEKFNGTFNIDVMNFKSLTRKFSKELFLNDSAIPDTIKLFYYLEVANKLKDKDNFLVKRMLKDIKFIPTVDDMIKEFKEYNFSNEELKDYLGELAISDSHKEKLNVVSEIYDEYITLLAEKKQYDTQDYINNLILLLDYCDLSEYIFYIDGYYNFSKQEYIYIQKIIERSKKTVISIIGDIERYTNFKLKNLLEGYEKELTYDVIRLVEVNEKPKYNLDIYRKSHEIVANINNIISNLKLTKYEIYSFVVSGDLAREVRFTLENGIIKNYSFSPNVHNVRYLNNDLNYLVQEYPRLTKSEYNNEVENISVILADNIQLEVREVARRILELSNDSINSEKGIYKNEDIAILYRDKVYEKYTYIFKDYNIPLHIDSDIDVTSHRLIKLLKNIFDFDKFDFTNSILNVLKTGLVNFENIYKNIACEYILSDNSELFRFEIDVNNSGNVEFENIDFTQYEELLISGDNISDINVLENAILVPNIANVENILRLKFVRNQQDILDEKFLEAIGRYTSKQLFLISKTLNYIFNCLDIEPVKDNKNVAYYIKKINAFFTEFDIKMTLDKESSSYDDIEELEEESIDRQVYSKVLNIINDMLEIVGNSKISYVQFRDILFLSLNKIKYRSIPSVNDMVVMSSMDLAKIENKKVVFILGFNKDIIPRIVSSNAILDDNDKEKLMLKNIFLSPTSKNKLIDEEFVSYIALSRVTDKIFISYSKLGVDYREQMKSIYLETINSIFPNLKQYLPSKVLQFFLNDLDYYLGNILDIYCFKEYSYLFSKSLQSYFDMNSSNNKNANIYNKLREFIIKYNNVNFQKSLIEHSEGVVSYNLTDDIDLEDKLKSINYYDSLKNNYQFIIDDYLKENYLEKKWNDFSKFSASKIQDYTNNPYMFFVKRILNVKEPAKYGITPLNSGSFYHKVLENEVVNEYIKKNWTITFYE